AARSQRLIDAALECFAVLAEGFMIDCDRLNPGSTRSFQALGAGDIGNDQLDEIGVLFGVEQRLQIAAASRNHHANRAAHAPRTSPITQACSPLALSLATIASAFSLATIRAMPMPRLKVRRMSSSGIAPTSCSQANTAGRFHALQSNLASRRSGSARGV